MVLHFLYELNQFCISSVTDLRLGQSCSDDGRSLFSGAFVSQHFVAKGSVIVLVIELKRDDHAFLAVLALKLLTHHEPHVRINSNAVAGDADSEGHAYTSNFILLRRGLCGAHPSQFGGQR